MLMYDNEYFYDSMDALQVLIASEQPVDRSQAFTSNLLGSRPEVTVENVNRSYPTMNPQYVTLVIYFGRSSFVDFHRLFRIQLSNLG
jgi:hypothetical protein